MNNLTNYNNIDIKKVTELTKSSLTSRVYQSIWREFSSSYDNPFNLTVDNVIDWIGGQKKKGLKISTINNRIAVLKSIYSTLLKLGKIKYNPFEFVKKFREIYRR